MIKNSINIKYKSNSVNFLNIKNKFIFKLLLFLLIFAIFSDIFIIIFYKVDIFDIKKIFKKIFFHYRFFTNQMILSILSILCIFLVGMENKEKQKIFVLITLVNSLLTFFVYNMILAPIWTEYNDFNVFWNYFQKNIFFNSKFFKNIYESHFLSIIQHTIIPLNFFIIFIYLQISKIKTKEIFLSFIHPLIYLFFYFLCLLEPLKTFLDVNCTFDKCWFPYPNIQCDYNLHKTKVFGEPILGINYFSGKIAVFLREFVLFILFSVFFYIIFRIKNKSIKLKKDFYL
ncbi:MAG: hypothetical protein Q8764_00895 [Pigeon pea little leaf phytoplasma]|uniref:Uncharacterized protein n=1 Tax=Candidatus Phytoplasma fabacearum TaxID=2982628 RepID=A0ABU8ZSA8_9MOLU|nr:hypothetical protein ['Bituminaria bituminosa' little leaf phytoplasma]MDV3148826.1 hypothetical protein [Pigeon pea little leaf phytoplasma]MDO7983531.1 hypothetical protein ['Bituminaria bituminosa' little leaf phytoplasma]MDO8023903.1 hypothetical protein ['Bituminaria bituminosa' little leaf phytoplasma]MDO8030663.1 hypothetical protein ['Bituminaria bituminosa' little leaf phytoplasma]MDV3154049.1 hypothetical protein [Pigeon pea little leaf phytoplasma]